MTASRWATFDCYGTLIDWEHGLGITLSSLWPDADRDALLARYHQIEEMGEKVPPLPEEFKTEANRVHGCQSIVHLDTEISDRAFDLGVTKQKLDSPETTQVRSCPRFPFRKRKYRYEGFYDPTS